MSYKTEMHLHSFPVSGCATITNEEIVRKYAEAGYSTVVLTNHINHYTFDQERFNKPNADWNEKIDFYMDGYNSLRKAAEGKLNILLGTELCLDGSSNDYLIYGMTEKFLRDTPNIMKLSISELSEVCKQNGFLLFQAHPFRNNMKVTDPCLLFGIEIFNGNLHHDSRNEFAEEWADHFGLHKSSGSDLHLEKFPVNGGIITDLPITSNEVLLSILKTDSYQLIKR